MSKTWSDERKAIEREKTRLRVMASRQRKKEREAGNCAQLQSKLQIALLRKKTADRKNFQKMKSLSSGQLIATILRLEREEKRAGWRERKRQERNGMSLDKQRKINEERRQKYADRKRRQAASTSRRERGGKRADLREQKRSEAKRKRAGELISNCFISLTEIEFDSVTGEVDGTEDVRNVIKEEWNTYSISEDYGVNLTRIKQEPNTTTDVTYEIETSHKATPLFIDFNEINEQGCSSKRCSHVGRDNGENPGMELHSVTCSLDRDNDPVLQDANSVACTSTSSSGGFSSSGVDVIFELENGVLPHSTTSQASQTDRTILTTLMDIVQSANRNVEIPEGVNVSKEARLAISKAASVFVLYATSCSNNYALKAKRKTIGAQDVLQAMEEMEFEQFIDPLTQALEAFRREVQGKKEATEKRKKERESATATGEGDFDGEGAEREGSEEDEVTYQGEENENEGFVITVNDDVEEDEEEDAMEEAEES